MVEWLTTRIENIAKKIAMGPFGSNIKVETFVPEGVPIISGQHLHHTRLEEQSGFNFITEEHAEKLKNSNVFAGDIVFTHAGNIGQVAVIPENVSYERYVISQRQFYLRVDPTIADPAFIARWFHGPIGKHRLLMHASQVGVPSISRPATNLKSIQIELPPIWEQRAISEVFDAIDDKIDLNRRMNETLEAMAQLIFKDWFVHFGPTRAKAEGREPYLAPELWDLFPEALDSEGKPVGWVQGILADVANSPRRGVTPADVAVDTPYIGLEHMPRRSIALSAWEGAGKVKSNKTRFHRGEILFGKLRPYFHKVGIAPLDGICSTDIVVAVPRAKEWRAFTLACLSSDEFVDYTDRTSTGTKMPRTSWKTMAQYKVCLPPEQLVRAFQGVAQPLLDRLDANVRETFALAQARDLLLPKLMSGKIRLRDNDVVAKEVA